MLFPLIATIQYGNSPAICASAPVRIGRGVAVIAFFLIIGINVLLHRGTKRFLTTFLFTFS